MFTGIVEEVGVVESLDSGRLRIAASTVLEGVGLGDSIAVNGCCLTVVEYTDAMWEADLSEETLIRTAFRQLGVGTSVNLERAVAASQRMGGHIVQGHVDAVGTIVEQVPDLRVRVPTELTKYMVEKGSVTVDGVSLTIVDVIDNTFSVAVIPHTADVTNLGSKHPDDLVNIEVDVIAKYVERMITLTSTHEWIPMSTEASTNSIRLDPVEEAIAAIAAGGIVVVSDDEDRENEGDLIMAADAATDSAIAFFVRYTSGVICVSLDGDRCADLRLPPMVPPMANSESQGTAFTVTVDLRSGTTTGISAADRAATITALADRSIPAEEFNRPGHIFPLQARPGGVLKRAGHTEAALDLARLAGRESAGVLCELVAEDGSMMRAQNSGHLLMSTISSSSQSPISLDTAGVARNS